MTETTGTPAPPTEQADAVRWLLDRHPAISQLLTRFNPDPLEAAFSLQEAFDANEAANQAWSAYEERHHPPSDDVAYQQWQDAGPTIEPAAQTLGVMSGGEKRAVRMIAMLTGHVAIGVEDLYGIDFPGSVSDFIDAWLQLVATGAGRW